MTAERDTARTVLHVDIDAFFAAIEQQRDPRLKGKPVIVGAAVIASCSYEARKFGLRAGMSLSEAKRLCPRAIILEGHAQVYRCYAERVFERCRELSPDVETYLDEAYLELTGTERMHGPPLAATDKLLRTITRETGLPCSGGLATTRLTAKVASDQAKPRGLVWVAPGQEAKFLAPLPVRKIPGIGKVTERALRALAIETVAQLAEHSSKKLEKIFGQWGTALYRKARGGDSYEFIIDAEPKSISHNHTFGEDTNDLEALHSMLSLLSQKTCKRLREAGLAARTLTLTIRYAGFDTYTRSHTMPEPVHLDADIQRVFLSLFEEHRNKNRKIRLLGTALSNLTHGGQQLDLLNAERREKLEKLTQAADKLRDRFGFGKIQFGGSLKREE